MLRVARSAMSRSWLDAAGLDGAPEDLWEDGDRRFYKIWRESTGGMRHAYLAVLPATDPPTRGSLRRLEHEYELKDHVDAGWALRPLELVRGRGATALVLEYQDGQPLERMMARPMEVGALLRIAVALASGMDRLHAHGLVHKDIKPANILVDPAGDRVWLMGFGVASRIPRERQSPDPPEFIAGTLSHMAPEQTGRMNRSVDSRSDLYSLGVTLYQAVAGTLPFMASDPLEWVHCHVARSPLPLSARVTDVSPQLSAIIMKLLAKTPEERYQTAVGVERDLRRCLANWDTRRAIEEFPLAEHDVPDRLLIPERLYGREGEIDALLAAFEKVVTVGKPALVLVSGHPGTGKSSVVNELHKMLVPPRGLFASGKFDQLRRDIPYATLAQAFQSLVRQLLVKPEAERRPWREELRQALAPNGALLLDLVPELEFVIGEQPAVPEAAPADAKIRFQTVLRRLIGVFARSEHPLALFLDDLQWLDAATLDLLENIIFVQPEAQHLLLVGAYRDNEVDATHPLKRTLSVVRENGAVVHDIALRPLDDDDLNQWFADALHCSPERTRPLAQLVHEKTAGNPFFVNQFLQELVADDLVTFETDAGGWHWDLAPIRSRGYTDNVVDLMVGKLSRLPLATQEALKDLACLGSSADASTLAMVHEVSEEQLHSDLWEALRLELLVRSNDSYRFVHDRVQEAAYALIPEERRAPGHLRIGRLLTAKIPPDKHEEVVFDIVSHYNRASSLLISPDEREELAALNLVAARRAKASAAFASALSYVVNGAALLTEESWQDRHALAFALQLTRAECEYVTHQFGPAEERLNGLALRATSLVERAAVAALQIEIYWTLGQGDRAIGLGLDYLRHVGVDWSPHPSDEHARREYDRIRTQFGRRSFEDLINLPLLTDAASLATLDILVKLAAPTFTTDTNLSILVACCGVNISMERGNCDASCAAYEWLAIAAGRFGDYDAAYRFGRLGYELTEQRGLRRFQSRTYLMFGTMVMPWTKPIGTARDVLRRAFTAANEIGDMSVVASCGLHLNSNMLAAGDPLLDVEAEAARGLAHAQQTRFGLMIDAATVQLALIRTLRGQTWRFGHLDDGRCDERELEKRLPENPNLQFAECCYWLRKLQARALAGEWTAAMEAARQTQRLVRAVQSFPEEAEYHLYSALTHAACFDSASDHERSAHVESLAAHHRQLGTWAQRCPENFESCSALAGAELARIEGRELDAERLYEAAIKSAGERAFFHHEALANERASEFYAARDFETISHAYLRNARDAYLRWGADGKVRQLDERHPHLKVADPRPDPARTVEAPVEQLDLATVIEVSEALSGEMLLEKLMERLMRAAIEHAGAERGLLISPQGEKLRIDAGATARGENVAVQVRERAVDIGVALAESVIRYALRTRETVILDDASSRSLFSVDPYIVERRARSILCLPLINQGRIIGLLYLENNLAPHVFTPDRVTVLKLLASQAAISLEKTRLYRDLADRELRVRRLVDANVVGIVLWHLDGRILEANDAFLGMVQYSRDDLVSGAVRWPELTPAEWRERDEQAIAQLKATATVQPYEKEFFRKDGSRVTVLAGGALFEQGGNDGVAFVLDLSERKRAEAEIRALKDQLYRENLVLRDEVDRTSMFEEIVGTSKPLNAVLSRLSKVAPTDSTVLITGETGTGKELVARAIHRRSARASRAFVSVNCAAIPRELIASELFGHERGAFTGAVQRRLGRLEVAHGVTIFLDEVGDLPLDSQVALLRVLQEREFDRVGGSKPVQVDVRVIAATNRDLQAAIESGTFRSDLYYRLNVFPISVPALRERSEDISLLVEYFIDRYARQAGKTIRRVNKRTLDDLRSYPWPGNVRELQNVIERSVIVCDTDEFTVDESWLSARPVIEGRAALSGTLAAQEKAVIEDALRACGGRVFGPAGAAARLSIPRSTLESKIRALRINKNRFRR